MSTMARVGDSPKTSHGWQGPKQMGHPPLFPRTLSANWFGNGTSSTWTGACMKYWHCGWWLYPLHHNAGPQSSRLVMANKVYVFSIMTLMLKAKFLVVNHCLYLLQLTLLFWNFLLYFSAKYANINHKYIFKGKESR